MTQLDNSTLTEKVRLRRRVLAATRVHNPVVLETHGGWGRIYERTWYKAERGVVIEKDGEKAAHLAQQRPLWSVYQGDCEKALGAGLARSTPFDIVDLDPYGHPFNVLAALSLPGRVFPDRWQLVVNDGNRQKVQRGGSWHMATLAAQVRKYGTNLYPIYLKVAREAVEEFANKIGFGISSWLGYYAGEHDLMTHYWVVLQRLKRSEEPGVVEQMASKQPGVHGDDDSHERGVELVRNDVGHPARELVVDPAE